jgi:ABC-2 type transport system ATP-binding protein
MPTPTIFAVEGKDRVLAIEADGLTRRFGRVEAVSDLHLTVEQGEIFGLIGPDGAGKTTMIRLLAAVMLPSAGQARVLGHDTRREAAHIRSAIGYMPQKFSLYGDLTVTENLAFYADVFGVRGRERARRIEALLGFARLTDFTRRRAGNLSGGMQKKLALACTLVHAPQVIFLDEPTTGVDPISRREFWDILAGLHVQGVTQFITTPYMDEAERCSRVGLMHQGRIIQCAAPEVLRHQVPGELLSVWPATGNLSAARTLIVQLPGVLEVQTYGDVLHVFVTDAEQQIITLGQALTQAGIAVTEIARRTPRVEEAFISLIKARQAQATRQSQAAGRGQAGAGQA